jgi:predicted DNA repair protein MutK
VTDVRVELAPKSRQWLRVGVAVAVIAAIVGVWIWVGLTAGLTRQTVQLLFLPSLIVTLLCAAVIDGNLPLARSADRTGLVFGEHGFRFNNTRLGRRLGEVPWDAVRVLSVSRAGARMVVSDSAVIPSGMRSDQRRRLVETGLLVTAANLAIGREEFAELFAARVDAGSPAQPANAVNAPVEASVFRTGPTCLVPLGGFSVALYFVAFAACLMAFALAGQGGDAVTIYIAIVVAAAAVAANLLYGLLAVRPRTIEVGPAEVVLRRVSGRDIHVPTAGLLRVQTLVTLRVRLRFSFLVQYRSGKRIFVNGAGFWPRHMRQVAAYLAAYGDPEDLANLWSSRLTG